VREPFISLFLAAFPVLVISLYNIIYKKFKVISSKSVNYILLSITSLIVIYCIIAFVSSFVKDIVVKTIWPSNTIFIAAIIIFVSGILDIIIKNRHSVHPDYFINIFGIIYTSLIIIWGIVGYFY